MDFISLIAQAKGAGLPVEWLFNVVTVYFMLSRPISKIAKALGDYKEDSDYKFKQLAAHNGIELKSKGN